MPTMVVNLHSAQDEILGELEILMTIVLLITIYIYRVFSQLLRMSVQLNVSFYGNKQNLSNVDTLMHTHICPIYLYDWTLNDLAYCHNKTHLTEHSFSAAG